MSDALPSDKPRSRFKSPLAALAASFALGIVVAHSFRIATFVPWTPAMACACLLVGLFLLRAGWDRTAVCFALAAMTFAGVADVWRWQYRFPLNHICHLESMGVDLSRPLRIEGRVISTPYRTGYALQFDVDVQTMESLKRVHAVTGKIRLRVQGAEEDNPGSRPREIRYGDVVRTSVRLRQPHIYQNPGSFDFRRWMEDIEDLYWVGTVRSPKMVEIMGHASGFLPAELAEHARQRLLRGIDDLYPPWSAQWRNGAVLKAVLWGDRTALDSATIDDFRKTGLYHLLVIAGLHVGLLTLLVEFLLRAMRIQRVARAFVVLSFLAVYACLVEQRAATLRATLMIGLYLLARILDRGHSPLNSIGGVALILLYYRPAWLFESGFQLSFTAALLIVSVAVPILERTTEPYRRALLRLDDVLLDDRFSPRMAQVRLDLRAMVQALRRRVGFFERFPALARNILVAPLKLLVWAANIVVFSAILQLGLLLPMVETFHRVTFAGVGLNALAIPVMTVLLALALPINLLSVASPVIAAWPAKALNLVMAVLFGMTHLPGMAGWLSYRMPGPPWWVAWGFCAAFVLAACTLRYARQAAGWALAACGVFVVLVAVQPFEAGLPRGTLEMTALDCGQGDALFVVLPDGATMLLDAGGSRTYGAHEGSFQGRRWDPGEDIVSPYLWSRGIRRIDVVVLTHGGTDSGLDAVLANFEVGEFWHAPYPESPEYAALLDKVAERGVPTRTLMARDTLSFGGAQIRVLWPGVALGKQALDLRAASRDPRTPGAEKPGPEADDEVLAMRISAGGVNFLLPGDVGTHTENAILASGEPLESQVLELAYQRASSAANQDFLSRVAPRAAIISSEWGSAGANDSPLAKTVAALQIIGARIFRTDVDGAITVESKGGRLLARTYRGREEVIIGGVDKPAPPP